MQMGDLTLPRHETGGCMNKHDRIKRGETLKRPYLYCGGCVKTGRMANFNAHKHYFRAAVWDGAPDGTAVAVSSPGGLSG